MYELDIELVAVNWTQTLLSRENILVCIAFRRMAQSLIQIDSIRSCIISHYFS